VVRENQQLQEAYDRVMSIQERAKHCALTDTGNWSNQNVIFTKAFQDMLPVALCILKGALLRDECRGAHFKPAFAPKSLVSQDPVERRREAEEWCDQFEENSRRFLKSSVATWKDPEPDIQYEPIDTSLIPPRPRLYGLVGADAIEEAWKARAGKKVTQDSSLESKPASLVGQAT
jgi:succinate dehydrogenase / fumarate reductase flavoprotein subunit